MPAREESKALAEVNASSILNPRCSKRESAIHLWQIWLESVTQHNAMSSHKAGSMRHADHRSSLGM
jgi:hypothetical protein